MESWFAEVRNFRQYLDQSVFASAIFVIALSVHTFQKPHDWWQCQSFLQNLKFYKLVQEIFCSDECINIKISLYSVNLSIVIVPTDVIVLIFFYECFQCKQKSYSDATKLVYHGNIVILWSWRFSPKPKATKESALYTRRWHINAPYYVSFQ